MPKTKSSKAKTGHRATEQEREDRFRDIDALLDKGHKSADIARVLEKRYGISRRQAERDIQQVKARRSQVLNLQTAGELRSEHYQKLEHLYQYCLQKGDSPTALKVLALKDELIDKVVTLGDKSNAAISSSTELSASELAELMAALAGNGKAG